MSAEEHRYHTRLQGYWDKIRGDKAFPRENDVNPDELQDIWDSCFLISIDDVTRRAGYRYSYIGQDLVAAYGSDAGSPDINATLHSTDNAPMMRKFDEVVASKAPVVDEAEFMNQKQLNIRYRMCILPLGTHDGVVTHLLGCMRWKMY